MRRNTKSRSKRRNKYFERWAKSTDNRIEIYCNINNRRDDGDSLLILITIVILSRKSYLYMGLIVHEPKKDFYKIQLTRNNIINKRIKNRPATVYSQERSNHGK